MGTRHSHVGYVNKGGGTRPCQPSAVRRVEDAWAVRVSRDRAAPCRIGVRTQVVSLKGSTRHPWSRSCMRQEDRQTFTAIPAVLVAGRAGGGTHTHRPDSKRPGGWATLLYNRAQAAVFRKRD